MSCNCLFCSVSFPLIYATEAKYTLSFDTNVKVPSRAYSSSSEKIDRESIEVYFFKCPECKNVAIQIVGIGKQVKGKTLTFEPNSNARQFPAYIPKFILEDYAEACAIKDLSPKASATLLRRCLQGIIRDFYSVTKNRLIDEIDAIQDKVDSNIVPVLNALRQIGNIGAHPERDISIIVDIEPHEAEKLIKFIEYLLEQTYIKRYESEKLFEDIVQINNSKK